MPNPEYFKWKKGIAEETKCLTQGNTSELKCGFRNFVRLSFPFPPPNLKKVNTLKTYAFF